MRPKRSRKNSNQRAARPGSAGSTADAFAASPGNSLEAVPAPSVPVVLPPLAPAKVLTTEAAPDEDGADELPHRPEPQPEFSASGSELHWCLGVAIAAIAIFVFFAASHRTPPSKEASLPLKTEPATSSSTSGLPTPTTLKK